MQVSAPDVRLLHADYLWPCLKAYYDDPLVIESADGVWVTDDRGRTFLDLFAGILTTSVGHGHPRVVEAVQRQAATLGHTSTLYRTAPQGEVAEQIAEIAPGDLRRTFFVNSGTEAVETAIMLACLHTGRSEVVALRHAYSGRSFLATNITAHGPWRPLPTSVPGIKHALAPYPYRQPFGDDLSDEELSDKLAADLEEVILTTTSGGPACFIAESIQGVGGFVVPPQGYFQKAAAVVRKYGGLFIADEVQTGFGRTGHKWFGIEHWGVEPDVMVMAKGIASGYPVGAVTTTDEIAASWTAKSISTYGGSPVSMAAAGATIATMVEEDVPTRSAERGAQLRAGLAELFERYEWIGEVRGMGLMQAMELVESRETKEPAPKRAKALLEATKDENLLIGLGGLWGQTVRLGPSMLITEDEIADALGRLSRACATVNAG